MIFYFFNFFIGTCLASHACVVYEHFKNGNFVFGRSHCQQCNHLLHLYQQIPIISFLILKGRCFYCKNKIPIFLPCTEIIGGFALLFNDFGNIFGWINACFYFIFLLVAIFDYFEHEFPTCLLIPMLLTSLITNQQWQLEYFIFLLPIIFLFIFFIKQNKIGAGDLYIYILLSLYLTPQKVNYIFLIACLLIILRYLFMTKIINQKQIEIPFIPYIFIGSIIIQFVK